MSGFRGFICPDFPALSLHLHLFFVLIGLRRRCLRLEYVQTRYDLRLDVVWKFLHILMDRFTMVYHGLLMFTMVYLCLPWFTYVYHGLLMFT